jgi:pimeloyl-ACP methyl ester carboxylesterase
MDIVAWSYGALATLDFALDYPGRIRRLVLIEPPALWALPQQGRTHEEVRDLERTFPDPSADISEEDLERFLFIAGFVPPGGNARELPQWSNWTRFRRSLRNTKAVFAHEDDLARLRGFGRPVLLVTGTGTSPFLEDVTERLASSFPNARVVEMPAGHAPHIVSTDRFLAELGAFLAQ